MRARQSELEKKISRTMQKMIMEQMAQKPEYVRTYLSDDMATIYVVNNLIAGNNNSTKLSYLKQKFEGFKDLMKNRLKKLVHTDILGIFPIIDPKGILIFIVILCNQN